MDGTQQGQRARGARRGALLATVAVALVLAVLVGWQRWGGAGSRPAVAGTSVEGDASSAATVPPPVPSVPVSSAPGTQGPAPGKDGGAEPAPAPTLALRLEDVGEPLPGVRARITAIEAVEGEARGPGEVGGPSLRLTVEVDNATDAPLVTRDAVLNVYHGPDATPATALGAPGAQALPREVPAGASATARYVVNVPEAGRDQLRVELVTGPGAAVLLFTGAVDPAS